MNLSFHYKKASCLYQKDTTAKINMMIDDDIYMFVYVYVYIYTHSSNYLTYSKFRKKDLFLNMF